MKRICGLIMILIGLSLIPANVFGGDFKWFNSMNAEAESDLRKFGKVLQERFGITREKVEQILNQTETPSDAYMSLKLGEISKKPVGEVLDRYQNDKKKGWGALAKSLGIKPGSKEFHQLKAGHDLNADKEYGFGNADDDDEIDSDEEDNGKGKGRGKGKGKKMKKNKGKKSKE